MGVFVPARAAADIIQHSLRLRRVVLRLHHSDRQLLAARQTVCNRGICQERIHRLVVAQILHIQRRRQRRAVVVVAVQRDHPVEAVDVHLQRRVDIDAQHRRRRVVQRMAAQPRRHKQTHRHSHDRQKPLRPAPRPACAHLAHHSLRRLRLQRLACAHRVESLIQSRHHASPPSTSRSRPRPRDSCVYTVFSFVPRIWAISGAV